MNRTLHLVSVALLIPGLLLSLFIGSRFVASPYAVFQLGTALNSFMAIVVGLALAVMLGARLMAVLSRRVDISTPRGSGIAALSQKTGRLFVVAFYALYSLATFAYVVTPPARNEIVVLTSGLLPLLPTGLLLFEAGRLMELERRAVDT
ncbi:MAG: hypothetical protein AAFX44_06005 [Pseudomonadota bacterium]